MPTPQLLPLTPRPALPSPSPTEEEELRVLDISIFYTPSSGGVRTYLDAKSQELERRGISHALVIPHGESGRSLQGRTRVYRLRGPRVPTTPGYRLLVSPLAIEEIFRVERPTLVELGSPFLVPSLVHWAVRRGPRPILVGFTHSDLIRTYVLPYLRKRGVRSRAMGVGTAERYIRSVYSRCDATIAASPSVAGELERMGVPRVSVVPLGVDLSLFHPERRTGQLREWVGAEAGVPLALFAGRFCPEKRLDVVLEAQARLPLERRPHLVLVGEGPSEGELRRWAALHPRVTILPFETRRERLAGMMADADFYLASGPGETFGLAVAEALASGLPVLGVRSGAVPDRLGGSGAGELYEDGDVEGCAVAMERLTGRLTPELRGMARLHAEGSAGWGGSFDALLALYRALARRGSGVPSR